jgi:hypothetical protein
LKTVPFGEPASQLRIDRHILSSWARRRTGRVEFGRLNQTINAGVPACAATATTFWDKTVGTLTALTATNCEWTQFDLGWMFTLFFVLLGSV